LSLLADEAVRTWSVPALARAIRSGNLRATELLELCQKRTEARNDELRAFVYLDWAAARQAAEAVDAAVARGEETGPLAGIPFGVKDTEDCAGMPTEFGSLLRRGAAPAERDAPHVARLRAAGAIPVGKTATPEFMSGLLTESKATGVTRNPWNPAVTPGGSSGGSAAAVAGGMVPFATGSDGGGSLRIPASYCGLVGFKTSLGAIPLPEREPSMTNCEGVLTCDVASTAVLIDIMSGPLDEDPVSYAGPPPGLAQAMAGIDLAGLRVVYAPNLGGAGAAPDVARACLRAAAAVVVAENLVNVPDAIDLGIDCEEMNDVFVGVGAANPWPSLPPGELRDHAELLSDYFLARLERAAQVSMEQYGQYHERRQLLRAQWTRWFDVVDAVLLPTVSTCAVPAAGPPPHRVPGQRFAGPAAAAPLTRIANMMGVPSVSVPVGVADNGVPIGFQVIGGFHRDALVLRLGQALQSQSGPAAALSTG
jgi:aspartyl-tRNA(Asn)/glutamyl-tRNA(Gln) amidotransferase subunit A